MTASTRSRAVMTLAAALVLALAAVGCGGGDATDPGAGDDGSTTGDAAAGGGTSGDAAGTGTTPGGATAGGGTSGGAAASGIDPATLAPDLAAAVAFAVDDAAASAGADASAIVVVEAETVTWPDGSLGCPEPDMLYTQALVDGYRIVLEVAGTPVAYHGTVGSDPFVCRSPEPPLP